MQSAGRGAVRLDSAFQRDWLDKRFRLVIGDMVTGVTEWSVPARFAGIRVGTDLSLQPTLVAFPLLTRTEAATLPSTLELILSAGSQKVSVQPGAFPELQPLCQFSPVNRFRHRSKGDPGDNGPVERPAGLPAERLRLRKGFGKTMGEGRNLFRHGRDHGHVLIVTTCVAEYPLFTTRPGCCRLLAETVIRHVG